MLILSIVLYKRILQMARNHTRYIFSMGELKRKDNSIAFKNEKGNFYIPIQDTRELYCMNEVSFNTKFLDFISKAELRFICLIIMEIIVELFIQKNSL